MSLLDMVVLESTESTQVVVVWLVVSITTEPTSINTTLVTSVNFHKTQNKFWKPTINLEKLWTLVDQETRDAYISGDKKDTAPVFDLLPLGYSKLLGKGRLPDVPIVVRARWVSKEAERKIKEAGGVIELVA
ncbi:60S ribosomal protein L28 [Neophaeococcomyces mojaviensis]|uniref:60S ribosomal protein L28 n=1 Tax=Neophaeococcomyces mojaviensis TaxID=3383035 RepID=A0ACC3ACL3_9EURO|nr:60S ribosomal protein L28 [Knufia sp. JES_112]